MTSAFSKSQLNAVLSALDGQRRNPNTKNAALRAIDRHAERLGVGRDDLLTAAAGLLDGRMNAEAFRTSLRHEVATPAGEPEQEPDPADDKETNEAEAWEAELEDEQGRLAITRASRDAEDHAQHGTPKQQLLAACQAAEHWLLAERDRPGETRPDEILCVLRAAIERAESQPKPRTPRQSRGAREPGQRREGSKEAMVIEMLRRPEGTTIMGIAEATGWQQHAIRGLFAAALKKPPRSRRHLGEAGRR